MCFTIPKSAEHRIKNGKFMLMKAVKDIVVAKRISHGGLGWFKQMHSNSGNILRWKRGFRYKENNGSYVPVRFNNSTYHAGGSYLIGKGVFHSIIFKPSITSTTMMIIPEGSYYYFSKNSGEYISKELIYPDWEVRKGKFAYLNLNGGCFRRVKPQN